MIASALIRSDYPAGGSGGFAFLGGITQTLKMHTDDFKNNQGERYKAKYKTTDDLKGPSSIMWTGSL